MTYKILLCDDEYHILRAAEIKFARAGFDVHSATDGLEAWELIQDHAEPFDLLITDCQMPRLNGLQLIERLREQPETSELPIIMLTAKGYELKEDELKARLGIYKLIAKPFSPRELLMTVSSLLEPAPFAAAGW